MGFLLLDPVSILRLRSVYVSVLFELSNTRDSHRNFDIADVSEKEIKSSWDWPFLKVNFAVQGLEEFVTVIRAVEEGQ